MSCKTISVEPIENLPEKRLDTSITESMYYYGEQDKKVFFGHYWLKGNPSLCKENVCCLDFSVAKGGKLVAYRLNEEAVLDGGNLVYV